MPPERSTGGALAVPFLCEAAGGVVARGADIGPQYTNAALNNSYFVDNVKEEADHPDEWFFDEREGRVS